MAEPLVLGIDAGGSKTLLALATRAGDVAALRRGGGINPFDRPDWRDELSAAVRALDGCWAGVLAAVAGMPGYGELDAVSGALEAALGALLPCRFHIVNDVQVAFDGAFQDRAGVLLLAGTGSMAWAQSGITGAAAIRVGGWGHEIGDEGSAFWIGQRAVGLLSQMFDGRAEETPFAGALLARIGVGVSPGQTAALLGWYSGLPHRRSAVAAIARDVSALAESGDGAASGIMAAAAALLCDHVVAARRWLPGCGQAWSHAGGVFNSVVLQRGMAARLGPPTPPVLPPVGGALWRAARLAGWSTDAAWTRRLSASLATDTLSADRTRN